MPDVQLYAAATLQLMPDALPLANKTATVQALPLSAGGGDDDDGVAVV